MTARGFERVIGGGTMGSGIAHVFAMAGFPVLIEDLAEPALERARTTNATSLGRLVKKVTLDAARAGAANKRVATTTDLAAMADRDIGIKALVETLDVWAGLLKKLDAICGDGAILASNSSAISLTEPAATSALRGQVIGMHFFNPVPMMHLVEIIRALQASDVVANAVNAVKTAIGKTPRVSKDSYGFIVNRLVAPQTQRGDQRCLWGIATTEDIDSMMMPANCPMGPLSLGDLIGLNVVLNITKTLYGGVDNPKYRPSTLLNEMVTAGYLGRKSGKGFAEYSQH